MPYNNPIKKKDSACKQLKSEKGKPTGLMMEGSVNHMSMLHKETDKQEVENLEDKNPVAEKASVLEMGHESPAKMSPLNDNHNIDPKTGKRVVQPFVDPGPDPSQGFTDDSRPYDLTSEGGGRGQYDSEDASRRFMGAQKQAQNALSLAGRQLSGEEVFNTMIKGGYGSRSLTGPKAAQIITGYSSGEEGQETVGGGGKVRFNKDAVKAKLDELNKLAITNPVEAKRYISKRISGAPLGDFANKFQRDINPLKRN